MNASMWVLALLDGTTQAALLFLVALGLSLIFGVMRILNVAHGSFYAFGGYAAATVSAWLANGESVPMSVLGFDGQFSVYDPRQPDSPCYACLFPPDTPPPEVRCATMGVLAPLVGVMGAMQATEALKILMGLGSEVPGRLLMLDGHRLQWTEMRLSRSAHCPVCGRH